MTIQLPSAFASYLIEFATSLWVMIFDLAAASGVIVIPLLLLLVPSLKRLDSAFVNSFGLLLNVLGLTIIYMFCVQPFVESNVIVKAEADVCVQVDAPGAAQQFGAEDLNGELPVWWALVLSFSSALGEAGANSLNCEGDLRAQASNVLYGNALPNEQNPIGGPDGNWDVDAEINRFQAECHSVAYQRWLQEQPPEADAYIEEWGADLNWIGSRALLDMYYPEIRAADVVSGFPFEYERDDGYVDIDSQDGRPFCHEWWADPEVGLRVIILDHIGTDQVESLVAQLAGGDVRAEDQARDVIIQEYINQAEMPAPIPTTSELFGEAGGAGGFWNGFSSFMGAVGLGSQTFRQSTVLHIIRIAGPLIAVTIIALILILMPIVLLMTGFNGTLVMAATLVLVTLMLYLQFFYQLAGVFEHRLSEFMFPNAYQILGVVASAVKDPDYASRAMIVNLLVGTVHVGLVVITFLMLAWGGRRIFGLGDMMSARLGEMGNLGGKGVDVAKDAAQAAASRGATNGSAWKSPVSY